MSTGGNGGGASPLEVVVRVVTMLEDLGVDHVIGGSLASSFFGEPRSTADVDVAIRVSADIVERLLDRAAVEFHLPDDSARRAIRDHGSFNLIDVDLPFKVDLFVLGDGILDRNQLARRVRVPVPGLALDLWVTSPEDQVLRTLDWYRTGGGHSERQWSDVIGLLRVQADQLDWDYIEATAAATDLNALLAQARRNAESGTP